MTAKVALEIDADYVLFLDDDVLVDPNYGLKQLFDCNADIAAGKICVRGYPFDYMSFQFNKKKELKIDKTLPKSGIVDKDAVGFSFALLKVSLLKKVEQPYFITSAHSTEDVYYCVKARMADPKCTIRINCACECGHILWPEVMQERNRDAYKMYFEGINKINHGATKQISLYNKQDVPLHVHESAITDEMRNMIVVEKKNGTRHYK
jgi:hypothetical protein